MNGWWAGNRTSLSGTEAGAGMNQGRRNVLLFYAGNVHRGSVRPKLMQLFGNDSDITIIPGQTSEQNYIK